MFYARCIDDSYAELNADDLIELGTAATSLEWIYCLKLGTPVCYLLFLI